MRDDDGGASSLLEREQHAEERLLACFIEAGVGLVKQDEGGVAINGARQTNPLALATGQK